MRMVRLQAEGRQVVAQGLPAYGFIRQYVPIAERDGYLWVVDSRPGEHRHQVIAFDKVGAGEGGTTWPSIGFLLSEITDALESGIAFDGWTSAIIGGELTWTLKSSFRAVGEVETALNR